MAKEFSWSAIAPAALFLTLCITCSARAQVTFQCETPYTTDSYGFIQMHQGADQDFYFMKRSTSQIQVFESPCGETVLWDYAIPVEFQSSNFPVVSAHDVTGDGISDFVLSVSSSQIIVVDPISDLILLRLDEAGMHYSFYGFADVDGDGLGELLVYASNPSSQIKYQIYDTNGSTGFESLPTPAEFSLAPAFPNPFNASVSIPFELERQGDVEVKIFNVLGSQVAELSQRNSLPGAHKLSWDAGRFPSGSYFYTVFLSGQEVSNQRIILLK